MSGEKILLLGPLMPQLEERARQRYSTIALPSSGDPRSFLCEYGPGIKALITSGNHLRLTGEILELLPQLEIAAQFGVGYDNIDIDAATRRGVVVTHTPNVQTDEVADMAVGLLISTIRQLPQAERYLREGKWALQGSFPPSDSLRGRKIGILGLGRIGEAVARRLLAFGVDVSYHSRSPRPGSGLAYYPSALALAQHVDVLMVTASGGTQSRHLVDGAVLAALGERGVVVNVARGSVIDQHALVEALRTGAISAAGLDVFEQEPNVPAELLALDRVVLLPHLAAKTTHTMLTMVDLVLGNLQAWFDKRIPLTPTPESTKLLQPPM